MKMLTNGKCRNITNRTNVLIRNERMKKSIFDIAREISSTCDNYICVVDEENEPSIVSDYSGNDWNIIAIYLHGFECRNDYFKY
jgi:hypothetical protein